MKPNWSNLPHPPPNVSIKQANDQFTIHYATHVVPSNTRYIATRLLGLGLLVALYFIWQRSPSAAILLFTASIIIIAGLYLAFVWRRLSNETRLNIGPHKLRIKASSHTTKEIVVPLATIQSTSVKKIQRRIISRNNPLRILIITRFEVWGHFVSGEKQCFARHLETIAEAEYIAQVIKQAL